jgi:hypothetical protein
VAGLVNVTNPAPVDPWSAGIMAAGSIATKALDKGSSQAQSSQTTTADFSAWTLSIGSSGATSAAVEKVTAPGAGATAGLLSNPIILAGLAIAVVLYLKS